MYVLRDLYGGSDNNLKWNNKNLHFTSKNGAGLILPYFHYRLFSNSVFVDLCESTDFGRMALPLSKLCKKICVITTAFDERVTDLTESWSKCVVAIDERVDQVRRAYIVEGPRRHVRSCELASRYCHSHYIMENKVVNG